MANKEHGRVVLIAGDKILPTTGVVLNPKDLGMLTKESEGWKEAIKGMGSWTGCAYPVNSIDFPVDRWSLRRFRKTVQFMEGRVPKGASILDLGTKNGLSCLMNVVGYRVENTTGEDLDLCPDFSTLQESYDCVTAFEILEHLVNPFEVLRMLPSKKLIASVPLRLWFAKAYNSNEADRHFHEFESWQFDWLLEKAGWKILDRQKLTSPTYKLGFRSILRWFVPRWYFIYAERI